MTYHHFLALFIAAAFITACQDPPEYAIEPQIAFISFNQDSIHQGSPTNINRKDTLEVRFSFTDGDGDLGNDEGLIDVFLTDSRIPDLPTIFRLPVIPREGTADAISGEIIVRMPNQGANLCCVINETPCITDPSVPTQNYFYTIQIQDRAGNMSNKVETTELTLICD